MSIFENVGKIKKDIAQACEKINRDPQSLTIVGVTKYVNSQIAKELYDQGITHLGENRADVFLEKHAEITENVTWHFIGTLQTRKVRDIINKIDYLHSLDRLSLAEEIQKRATGKVKCFVQVNVVDEQSKHGLTLGAVISFITQLAAYDKIEVVGLMTMAPATTDELVIRDCFSRLRGLQQKVLKLQLNHAPCAELSMGMTDDFKIAIDEGATFVRLGRCLVE